MHDCELQRPREARPRHGLMHPASRCSRRAVAFVVVSFAATTGMACTAETSVPAVSVTSHGSHDVKPATDADCAFQFIEMMIPHHRQAVEMGRLARLRGSDRRVRRMAEVIQVSQGREVSRMSGWLSSAADGGSGLAGAAGSTMPGLLTTAEMQTLRIARGEAFDMAYLRGMIRHHWGAVAMSEHALRSGLKRPVSAFATETVITQRAEIVQMERLLRSLTTGAAVTPEQLARDLAKTPLVNPFEGSPHPACNA
jgi:uncharacterized protein (DUF305 family)